MVYTHTNEWMERVHVIISDASKSSPIFITTHRSYWLYRYRTQCKQYDSVAEHRALTFPLYLIISIPLRPLLQCSCVHFLSFAIASIGGKALKTSHKNSFSSYIMLICHALMCSGMLFFLLFFHFIFHTQSENEWNESTAAASPLPPNRHHPFTWNHHQNVRLLSDGL